MLHHVRLNVAPAAEQFLDWLTFPVRVLFAEFLTEILQEINGNY